MSLLSCNDWHKKGSLLFRKRFGLQCPLYYLSQVEVDLDSRKGIGGTK